MAPAPGVGASELAAEMTEVYGLAVLSDMPYRTICEGGGRKFCPSLKNAGNAVSPHSRKGRGRWVESHLAIERKINSRNRFLSVARLTSNCR